MRRLATLALPLSVVLFVVTMGLLAQIAVPCSVHWAVSIAGGLAIAWLVRWDRRRERGAIARAARASRPRQAAHLRPVDQSGD